MSNRQFFSILLVFLAVFLLFQGTQAGKEYWNPYRGDAALPEPGLGRSDLWTPSGGPSGDSGEEDTPLPLLSGDSLLFVGDRSSALAGTVESWAQYAKRELRLSSRLPLSAESGALLLLDPALLPGQGEALTELVSAGMDLVLLDLPGPEALTGDPGLMALLGIRELQTESVPLWGMHLYPGFLLGGERIYGASSPEEEDRQDLPRSFPWYRLGKGTKVFLQGIPEGWKDISSELLPPVVWRCGHGSGNVYVLGGGFAEDRLLGMGLLAAVMAQRSDCVLYPVVNAQVVSVLNYPVTAEENGADLSAIYGRSLTNLEKNIILPMLLAECYQGDLTLSCYLALQYDYGDENAALPELAEDYLGELNELRGELGLSLLRREGVSLTRKLEQDAADFSRLSRKLRFTSACALAPELEELAALPEGLLPQDLRTVAAEPREDYPLLGYLDERVTLQQFTERGESHSFLEDLRLLGLETALGYSHTCFDMAGVLWPEGEEDGWQLRSQTLFSNLNTYHAPFRGLDSLTVTAADSRVRRFLALGLETERSGQTLSARVSGFRDEAFFLLRLFGREIASARGAEWTELESGTYLIRALAPEFRLELRDAQLPYYR